jgi:hypothetical protein
MTVILSLLMAAAQPAATTPPPIKPMTERQIDEANINIALNNVYGVISGPAGQKRDWAKMRSLFTDDARLVAITAKGLKGGTVDHYIETSGPLLEQHGFVERELGRRVEIYGNLAHAWSSYEGVGDGGKLKLRGINSFQLVRQLDGSWKVFTILWQPEHPTFPLPADMNQGSAN